MGKIELDDSGVLYNYTENMVGAPLDVSKRHFVRYKNAIASVANPTKKSKRRKKRGIQVHYTKDSFRDWVI